jgi:hypothetical protein
VLLEYLERLRSILRREQVELGLQRLLEDDAISSFVVYVQDERRAAGRRRHGGCSMQLL